MLGVAQPSGIATPTFIIEPQKNPPEGGFFADKSGEFFVQPVQNVFIDVFFVCLVEHFVAPAGIESDRHVVKTGMTESIVSLGNALSVFADRVCIT